MPQLRLAVLLPMLALASSVLAGSPRLDRVSERGLSLPVTPEVPVAAGVPSPCIQCGAIYAVSLSPDFGDTHYWLIKPDAGTAEAIGHMFFPIYFDIGISAAGQLYGVSASEDLHLIDACTFATPAEQVAITGGNSLAGDVNGPELYLGSGSPLIVYDTVADTTTFRGTFPTNWCGVLTGDLVMSPDPADGMLYGTMACASCPSGDTLVTIDPATGDMVAEIGCIEDAGGTGYANMYGLAFDDACRLFGSPSTGFVPGENAYIIEIDTTTAQASRIDLVTTIPNFWGEAFNGAMGLASLPCAPCGDVVDPDLSCAPRNHGWWHRECLGEGLIEPGRRGGGRGPDTTHGDELPADTYTGADSDLAAHGVLACEALDEGPFSDARNAALRQLATIYLNIRAGFLDLSCPVELHPVVEGADLDVADAIAAIEARLAGGSDAELREARWIGAHVVNGEALR